MDQSSESFADIVLRLEGVSYSYLGRYPALVDADLTIRRGERVVILGANGCGKSTLLKLMDGLLRPSAGAVLAFGEDVTHAAGDPAKARWLHRRVGLVFQDPDVQLFSPTVWDDVAFGPLQLGLEKSEVQRLVGDALRMMEIEHLADRAPYELSEGEKKRAAIATALALDPEVLLMDEPTANLDPRSKALLVGLIDSLADGGRTLAITTQELEIAPAVGRRAVVIGDRERRPVADGPVGQILNDTDLLIRVNLLHPRIHLR